MLFFLFSNVPTVDPKAFLDVLAWSFACMLLARTGTAGGSKESQHSPDGEGLNCHWQIGIAIGKLILGIFLDGKRQLMFDFSHCAPYPYGITYRLPDSLIHLRWFIMLCLGDMSTYCPSPETVVLAFHFKTRWTDMDTILQDTFWGHDLKASCNSYCWDIEQMQVEETKKHAEKAEAEAFFLKLWKRCSRGLGEFMKGKSPRQPSKSQSLVFLPYIWCFLGYVDLDSGPHKSITHDKATHPTNDWHTREQV